jgi:hypothetical protein
MNAAPTGMGASARTRRDRTSESKAQATLEDYAHEVAERAAATAISRVLSGDLDEWSDEALSWIGSLEGDTEFDASDLRRACSPAPSPNLIGAVFRRASKAGLIEMVDVARSRDVTRHGGLVRRWRTLP